VGYNTSLEGTVWGRTWQLLKPNDKIVWNVFNYTVKYKLDWKRNFTHRHVSLCWSDITAYTVHFQICMQDDLPFQVVRSLKTCFTRNLLYIWSVCTVPHYSVVLINKSVHKSGRSRNMNTLLKEIQNFRRKEHTMICLHHLLQESHTEDQFGKQTQTDVLRVTPAENNPQQDKQCT
jgi:hypothetical protein